MASFDSLKDLERYINQKAKEAMLKGNATKNVVIEEGKKQVQETVYDVYSPKVYERTGELKESWETEETADGIAVFNDRRDGSKDVADTVEYGRNYDYQFKYSNTPRPFTENTRKALDGSSKLTDGLRKDLKSAGIDVD